MSCAAPGPALAPDATGHRIALYNVTWDMQIKPNLLVKKRLANTGGRRRAHQVESGRHADRKRLKTFFGLHAVNGSL